MNRFRIAPDFSLNGLPAWLRPQPRLESLAPSEAGERLSAPVPQRALQGRTRRLVALVLLLTALATGFLWLQAERSREQLRLQLMQQGEQRSLLLADAMAGQISSMVGLADLALLSLRREWAGDAQRFDPIARQVLDAIPRELVTRTTVSNAEGQVLYSSDQDDDTRFVGDQSAFRAHRGGGDRLVVGAPMRSQTDGDWSFVISRPLLKEGRFDGVIQILISTEGVSRQLSSLQLTENDVVALIDANGTFLSRSRRNNEAMGAQVPADRPYVRDPKLNRGFYRAQGLLDGMDRSYGWQRITPHGLVVVVGLADASVLAPLDPALDRSRFVTGLLSAMLLVCGGLVGSLLWRAGRQQALVQAQDAFRRRQFESSLVPMGVMDVQTGAMVDCNPAAVRVYGFSDRLSVLGRNAVAFSASTQYDGSPSSEKIRTHIQQAIATGAAVFDWLHRRPDGSLWDAEVHLMSFESDGRALLQFTLQDITDRRRAEAALKESEARLKEAQALARIGSWELDPQTRRLIWSDELYNIFEVNPEDFVPTYSNIIAIVHPEDRARFSATYAVVAKERRPYQLDHRLLMPDGRVKYLRSAGVNQFNAHRPVRSLGTVQDITEVREAEDKLRRLNEELERRVAERTREMTVLNRDLESFAYSVSHDLRTPLRSLDGYASLLEADYGELLEQGGRSYLERIRQSARRMSNLINDMLTMAHLNRASLRHERLDLSELAQSVVAELLANEPDRTVQWQIQHGLYVEADPTLMRAVLQNLLGNAWKYTSRTADPIISLAAVQGADGGTEYQVRDNGAGFDMAYANQLFQPFKRLHAQHEFEGTGVGLATVQRIIERHGGTVRGEGRVGQGALFAFTLPPAADKTSAGQR